ncbi:Receptor-like protein 12 [Morella rubra]|uniref:Receptor-like protein 12 n=1 Tax=Morella rubra TaxID=262757 RepID=A0A6A1WKM5_9ROSI|nr:Receptor-like protein 12 [Morella rubra]
MRVSLFSSLFLMPLCSLFLSFCIYAVSGQCLGNQQSLLLQLKNTLVFNTALSTKLVHWDQNVNCSLWEGVTCDQRGVIGLDLSNESISGQLDNSNSPLPNLSNLFVVDLRSNQLQGPLPILKPNVNFVDLSWNNFSSNIPINIGNWLPNTIFFSLASNRFHGSIPESICNAAPLEVLDLSNNSFSGAIPRCLTSMNLGVLDLKRNSLTGTIPDTFSEQCALQTLDVNGNLLDGKLPESLANCTKLEVLDIGNIKVEDAFPCYLKNLSMLHVLVLRSNNFYGPIGCPRLNSTCPMLQILDLASK